MTVSVVMEIIVGVESKAGLFFLWGADVGHARLKRFLHVNMTALEDFATYKFFWK